MRLQRRWYADCCTALSELRIACLAPLGEFGTSLWQYSVSSRGLMQADDAFVLDATAREEQAADQACHIAVDPSGAICGVFMGSKAAVTPFALQVRTAAVLDPVSSTSIAAAVAASLSRRLG